MMTSTFTLAVNEKDVENLYRQYLTKKFGDIVFTSPFGCDGFGESKKHNVKLLCEFKDNLDLSLKVNQVKVLSQAIYYIKKFEVYGKSLPSVIFIGDRNECFVIHTNDISNYLGMNFDWDMAPSKAHTNIDLVNVMIEDDKINPHVFNVQHILECIDKIKDLSEGVERLTPITPHNVTEVFKRFEENVLGKHNLDTNQIANLFVQLLVNPDENYLHPVVRRKTVVTRAFHEVTLKSKEAFTSFFSHFSREYTPKQREHLTAVVDRLVQDITRRKQGEFFTPTIWVNKAHEYISSVYGEDWKEKYVVWDPAWGTGNLTRDYKFKELYCSTLIYADIETANQMGYNPNATKFQSDFLNDDYDFLPKGLKFAIESGKQILVLMNPPYQDGSELSTKNGESQIKGNVQTDVNLLMKKDNIGKCSKQLYAQFLYRVLTLNKLGNISIACFSPTLYLSGESYEEFQNKFFEKYEFEKGFIFNSSNFSDTSDSWPISFIIWKNGTQKEKIFNLDVLNKTKNGIEKSHDKKIITVSNEIRLVKNIKKDSKNVGEAFGACSFQGNTVQGNNQFVTILNGGRKLSGKGNFEIYPSNLFLISTFFSVRRLFSGSNIKWTEYYDDYLVPNYGHTSYRSFEKDSLIYSLFESKSNQLATEIINNQFFWMSKDEMVNLANQNNYPELYNDARTDSDRYVYNLLFGEQKIYDQLSDEAKDVLESATNLVRLSFGMRRNFADDTNHLNSWDAGYAQLKLLWKEYFPEQFKEFRDKYKVLEDKMRPMVYELGFLLK